MSRFEPRPADFVLAQMLGIKHGPMCRQINAEFNEKQPARQFQHFHCHCDYFERLDKAMAKIIKEDVANGVRRDLDD